MALAPTIRGIEFEKLGGVENQCSEGEIGVCSSWRDRALTLLGLACSCNFTNDARHNENIRDIPMVQEFNRKENEKLVAHTRLPTSFEVSEECRGDYAEDHNGSEPTIEHVE